MNIQYLTNGDIEMFADKLEQKEIKKIRKSASSEIAAESIFISEYLDEFEQVAPEEIGVLTSAPIISDGENCYGFMDYQVKSLLEELAKGKSIVWKKG